MVQPLPAGDGVGEMNLEPFFIKLNEMLDRERRILEMREQALVIVREMLPPEVDPGDSGDSGGLAVPK